MLTSKPPSGTNVNRIWADSANVAIEFPQLLQSRRLLFFSAKSVTSFRQLLGAGCLVIVVLTHLSEVLHLFPSMNWGRPHSIGHYLDFWSAVLGLTLFPVGYLFHTLTKS